MLGAMMVLTPLGQLASGKAWGEWGVEDFSDPQQREEIVAVSGSRELPADTPEGLIRLSSLWNSPIPDYEIPFLPGSVGYAFSAMLGVGLTLLIWLAVGWISGRISGRLRRQPSRG
jgi:cobalt/nickel transport system permease protein